MKKNKKITTLVHFILDKSGSMDSILEPTISGFNEYLNGLKKSKNKTNFSLTLFDTISIDKLYKNVPVKQVEPLNKKTYIPTGGTPLYDAVVDSVEELFKEVGDNKDQANVVVIMTDGEENASKDHDQKCLKELIEKLQAKGNWTFVYMGANQDAWLVAQKFGVSRGNSVSWNSTTKGTGLAMAMVAQSTADYSNNMNVNASLGKNLQTQDFFKGGAK